MTAILIQIQFSFIFAQVGNILGGTESITTKEGQRIEEAEASTDCQSLEDDLSEPIQEFLLALNRISPGMLH